MSSFLENERTNTPDALRGAQRDYMYQQRTRRVCNRHIEREYDDGKVSQKIDQFILTSRNLDPQNQSTRDRP